MYVPMLHDTQPTRLAAATERTSKSAHTSANSDSASLMPAERQTIGYIEAAEPISRIRSEHSGLPISQIRSARQAPSTIVTEQYLQARAASGPVYIQNVSATRTERISNLYADAPRFRNQIDILA
jgi:hypothetical protein